MPEADSVKAVSAVFLHQWKPPKHPWLSALSVNVRLGIKNNQVLPGQSVMEVFHDSHIVHCKVLIH